MTRYVTRKRTGLQPYTVKRDGWYVSGWRMGYEDEGTTATTAHVEERDAYEDTGLLDAEGNRLFRERDPIGFKVRS